MKIVFLDRASIRKEVVLTKPNFIHEWVNYDNTNEDDIMARAHDADIIISNKVPIKAAILPHLPKLKMIALTATGFNHIDITATIAKGIVTSNIRGYANAAVPEHVFSLLLALSRSLILYNQDVKENRWSQSKLFTFFDYPVTDLAGKTLTLIGKGALGNAVAKIATGFGMEVCFAEHKNEPMPREGYKPFKEAIAIADVISVHCPLFKETQNLLSLPEFKLMRKKPIIINTARGGVVNEIDVKIALDEGLIAAFGTDVLSVEPPSTNHPIMAIKDYPNVIITPHMAWASVEAVTILWQQLIDNIQNWHKGKPTNVVEG